ncbi:MAG: hypothetical protein ACFFCD_13865 [Promethearchaeota archaeon]
MMSSEQHTVTLFGYDVNATRVIVTTLGLILGVTGMVHGFFEVLQGNTPTGGILIDAIGPEQQRWLYGGESAITLIPNFLITGIVTMCISVVVILWTLFFIRKMYGSSVFLVLNILSFLTGGGVFQVVTFTLTWAFSTRINNSLDWWANQLSAELRQQIKTLWLPFTILGVISYAIVQDIAVLGAVPGITAPEMILNVVFLLLFFSLGCFILAFMCGFAYELERKSAT